MARKCILRLMGDPEEVLSPAELEEELEQRRREVDRSLIVENLRMTPEERLRSLRRWLEFRDRLQRAARAARRDGQ